MRNGLIIKRNPIQLLFNKILYFGCCFFLFIFINIHIVNAEKAYVVGKILDNVTKLGLNNIEVTWTDTYCGSPAPTVWTLRTGQEWNYTNGNVNSGNSIPIELRNKITVSGNKKTIKPEVGEYIFDGTFHGGGRMGCNCGPYNLILRPPTGWTGYFIDSTGKRTNEIHMNWNYRGTGNAGQTIVQQTMYYVAPQPSLTPIPTATPRPTSTPTPSPKPIMPTQIINQPTIAVAPRPTSATPSGPKKSQRFVCLNTEYCQNAGVSCPGVSADDKKSTVKLSIKREASTDNHYQLLPDKDNYIVECMQFGLERHCTTGSRSLDISTFGNSIAYDKAIGAPYLYSKISHVNSTGFGTAPNPVHGVPSDAQLGIWHSSTQIQIGRIFMAYGEFERGYSDYVGAMQQGSLDFITAQIKCIQVYYDPYGTVFDNESLRPIAGATITLFKQTSTGAFTKVTSGDVINGIQNPQITKADGSYYFHVQNGVYKLEIFHPEYVPYFLQKKIYDGYSNIYMGELITQNGEAVHKDIAMRKKNISAILKLW
ncbi:MAG: carboxypeptidase-like regulatory domain-containing protein [Candidatus Roizmanbacteria bacterium]